jgi:ABC-type multidrug transport system fused ATPase/permease subunit
MDNFSQGTLLDPIKEQELEYFRLKNINIRIKKHSLTAIVGGVGSGKSSLINAIIGEMKRESGRVIVSGTYSYCSQKAWIRNATIRENIILSQPFNQKRYNKVIEDCALHRDFELFTNGDQTEIGERGANLSGGQKQRINLARAVYFDRDIIFMDDPLSAVDAHVSRHLFDKCIVGALANKTRVLVTHHLHILPKVDYIICMKNGQIIEQGTFKELIEKNGELARLMNNGYDDDDEFEYDSELENSNAMKYNNNNKKNKYNKNNNYHQQTQQENNRSDNKNDKNNLNIKNINEDHENNVDNIDNNSNNEEGKTKVKGIICEEERATGSVKMRIYKHYIKASGGYICCVFIVFLIILIQMTKIGGDMWLVYWTEDRFKTSTMNYTIAYLVWNAGQIFLTLFFYIFMANIGIKAAKRIHDNAISRVIHAPIHFFDSNPLGRIINRFSLDQKMLDDDLFIALQTFFLNLASTISTLALMFSAAPILGVIILPILLVYYYIQKLFLSASRELKRINALKRSNLYANFSETMEGLQTIRAYNEEESFIRHNQSLIDNINRPLHLQSIAKSWLGIRLEFIGALLVLFNGVAGMIFKNTFSVSLLGLSLSYALQITSSLFATVRYYCNTEFFMNSTERLLYYACEIEQEDPKGLDAPKEWPNKGKIQIRNLNMKYRPYLPPTLHNISLDIEANEKIGIVGRTGAGKSSIIMTLLRLVEPELDSTIMIDNISISDLKLTELRKSISIIPQEPVLFSGTIRFNLDPLNEHTDQEIWTALENSGLRSTIMELDKKLESEVSVNGGNFSVGQRQLLCLARAMIKQSHILIMDEATASVDIKTDYIIQRAIRTNFNNTTVITIAHRLNTIIDYDKVLVLDKGKVLEYDSPKNLLFESNEKGELVPTNKTEFSRLIDETGFSNAEMLRLCALGNKFINDNN